MSEDGDDSGDPVFRRRRKPDDEYSEFTTSLAKARKSSSTLLDPEAIRDSAKRAYAALSNLMLPVFGNADLNPDAASKPDPGDAAKSDVAPRPNPGDTVQSAAAMRSNPGDVVKPGPAATVEPSKPDEDLFVSFGASVESEHAQCECGR